MPAKSIRWHCPARATLTFMLQIFQIPRAIRLAGPTIFSIIQNSLRSTRSFHLAIANNSKLFAYQFTQCFMFVWLLIVLDIIH